MSIQPVKRADTAPVRGGQKAPRNLCDVFQPVRRDARGPRARVG